MSVKKDESLGVKTIKEIVPPVSEGKFDAGRKGSLEKYQKGAHCTESNWRDWWEDGGKARCSLCNVFLQGIRIIMPVECTKFLCPLHDKDVCCCKEFNAVWKAYCNKDFTAFHEAEISLYNRIYDLEYGDYLKLYWTSMKGTQFEDNGKTYEIVDWRMCNDMEDYIALSLNPPSIVHAHFVPESECPIVRPVELESEHKAGERFRARLWDTGEDNVLWEHIKKDYPKLGEYFLCSDSYVDKAEFDFDNFDNTKLPIVKRVEEKAHRFKVGDLVDLPDGSKGRIYPFEVTDESKKEPEMGYPPDMIGRDGTPMWFCQYDENLPVVVYYHPNEEMPVGWDNLPSTFSQIAKTGNEPNRDEVMAWLKSGGYERLPKDKRVIDGMEFEASYDSEGDLDLKAGGYENSYLKSIGKDLEAGEIICRKLGIVPRKCKKGDC